MDFSIFSTTDAWVSLATLIFLEIVLGVDNLVFIVITTNRLPKKLQPLGRKLGLLGALIMRIIFLSVAAFLVHLTDPLFSLDLGLYTLSMSVRELVLLAGGAYLIYKGIIELRDMLRLTELKAEQSPAHKILRQIGLAQAIVTIMIMDVVFSIDSVITAVGLSGELVIMIIAVMIAVFAMMLFINSISRVINNHPEMKILALVFIVAIGGLLVLDSLGVHAGWELFGIALEKALVYFAMIFSIILTIVQMRYNKHFNEWRETLAKSTAEKLPDAPDDGKGSTNSIDS
ncbi:MAG: TerC family protein [Coriobacteriales bacterium]|jgi:predicted tellurium resistance membrane protein TerC|nr:TerC family protein [Coriobacteriales bacterium]